jgi:nicotinamidase-related amidase
MLDPLLRRGVRLSPLALALVLLPPAEARPEPKAAPLALELRTRVETFKGSGAWDEVNLVREFDPGETALVICDMWDKHWCEKASARCAALAEKMNPVAAELRKRGVLIVHAPSECMDFYKDAPQRKAVLAVPRETPPKNIELPPEPALPCDASDNGCDDEKPVKPYKAWTRQHPALTIAEGDLISDNGLELYGVFKQRGIKNVLVCGVHTNMCVLNRSFAIKQMTRWGFRCVLLRDLTDAMYNPKMRPFVSHEEGTELIIQHIEKYWCPTTRGRDVLREGK